MKNRISEICLFFLMDLFILGVLCLVHADDHTKPVLEPYKLAGKRLVFTNWFYVRTGHFEWVDQKGENVFMNSKAKLAENEASFVPHDYPYGIRLFVEPAERKIPIIPTDKQKPLYGTVSNKIKGCSCWAAFFSWC